MAGTLWALIFDPVVRFYCTRLPGVITTAYADDLAMAMAAFFDNLGIILPLFALVRLATGLDINFRKTYVVPVLPHLFDLFKQNLQDFMATLPDGLRALVGQLRVAKLAKHLGIFIGEGAQEQSYAAPWVKAQLRACVVNG